MNDKPYLKEILSRYEMWLLEEHNADPLVSTGTGAILTDMFEKNKIIGVVNNVFLLPNEREIKVVYDFRVNGFSWVFEADNESSINFAITFSVSDTN